MLTQRERLTRTGGDFVIERDLNTAQMLRARRLYVDVQDGPMTAACEIVALRDALVQAAKFSSHTPLCRALRGLERDCDCGCNAIKEIAADIQRRSGSAT